jgi:hypothetical protein
MTAPRTTWTMATATGPRRTAPSVGIDTTLAKRAW